MNVQQTFDLLAFQFAHTSPWEWIAVLFGILQVLLAWQNNVLLYPAGIISTACSIYVLAGVHLFAESFLNLYYLVMSIYGWWHWKQHSTKAPLSITRATARDWRITAAIVGIGTALLYFVLSRYTPSDVPFWDAWVSATAWAGMWLLAKRKLENWVLLNISNLFAIPLQFHKGIPLYALLTLILFVVAIFGFFKWKNLYHAKNESTAKLPAI